MCIRLRILCCHCYGPGCCCGTGSIPGLGTSSCQGTAKKEKKKKLDLASLPLIADDQSTLDHVATISGKKKLKSRMHLACVLVIQLTTASFLFYKACICTYTHFTFLASADTRHLGRPNILTLLY